MRAMAKKQKKKTLDNTIAQNKKARFDYSFEEKFEAGLSLQGWEVKACARARCRSSTPMCTLKTAKPGC